MDGNARLNSMKVPANGISPSSGGNQIIRVGGTQTNSSIKKPDFEMDSSAAKMRNNHVGSNN